jgi:hypothetical protein
MRNDDYRPWLPVESIPAELYCEGLHDDYEALRILLRGPESTSAMLRILFPSAIAYRNINESFRSRTWHKANPPSIPPLATVENSSWVAWLREESGGVLDEVALTHYAVTTPEDCIDVVTEVPPNVEWL